MRSRFWLASTALLSASSAGAIEHAQLVESWHAIPDQELAEMRGGLDLGSLIANFAIERLVRINGEVVARTQLVLSELGNLSNGGLPSIELAGNIASLIQVGENNAVVQATETAQTAANQAAADSIAAQATAAAAAAAAQAAAQQAAATASAPGGSGNSGATSQGGAGSVASINYAAGAGGLFGPGLAMAVAAANGELPGQAESNAANAAANASANAAANASAAGRVGTSGLAGASASGSSPAPAPATAAAASTGGSASTAAASATASPGTAGPGAAGPGAAGPAAAAAQPSGAPTLGTITVPVGNTGRTIVINNLPNAAALTTTIQNSVEAVRIDTETSISATMSSLAALRSSNFAAMLQQQAIDSVRR
ncbi:MAG TPA: hypothetical protein PK177_18840 [Burkholderiaceae bacterium]|nr:hypothetical protein [Burkholderiaceae bacterium]